MSATLLACIDQLIGRVVLCCRRSGLTAPMQSLAVDFRRGASTRARDWMAAPQLDKVDGRVQGPALARQRKLEHQFWKSQLTISGRFDQSFIEFGVIRVQTAKANHRQGNRVADRDLSVNAPYCLSSGPFLAHLPRSGRLTPHVRLLRVGRHARMGP